MPTIDPSLMQRSDTKNWEATLLQRPNCFRIYQILSEAAHAACNHHQKTHRNWVLMYILHLFPIYIIGLPKNHHLTAKTFNFNIHLYLAIRGPWPPWRPSRSHCSWGRTSGHGAAMCSPWATAPASWRWRWWPAPAPGRSGDRRPHLDRTRETTLNLR